MRDAVLYPVGPDRERFTGYQQSVPCKVRHAVQQVPGGGTVILRQVQGVPFGQYPELRLVHLGFDGISIGTESGDDDTLAAMNKGYMANDIIEQCKKLEEANIRYNLVYLTGLAGKGKGERNAINTANVFNQLSPFTVNFVSLTVFSESELYEEIQRGSFVEATEHERLLELRTFISRLHIKTTLLGNTVSNTVPFVGMIPNDRVRILNELDSAIKNAGEKELRRYRDSIRSL